MIALAAPLPALRAAIINSLGYIIMFLLLNNNGELYPGVPILDNLY